ncbi:hypothetical protein Purlil1_13828 [Purpureocillium lilacinum]|nr:hypothetical protein Purlil1_13828 [Purpureocillium lilacinum]
MPRVPSLGERFERTGSMDDLNRAVDIASQAVEATPQDDADRARQLEDLGIMLAKRFDRTESIDYLNLAIKITGHAVEATPHDHPDRAG